MLLNHEYHKVHTTYSFSDFYKCSFWKISHEVLSSSQQYFMSIFLQVFISNLLLLTTAWTWKKVKVIQSCPTLCKPMDSTAHGILQARIVKWVASLFSRGSSQTRDWTQVPTLQENSLPAEPQESPTILEWVAYPFSSGSSPPRNQTQVSCPAGRFFTNWAIRKSYYCIVVYIMYPA